MQGRVNPSDPGSTFNYTRYYPDRIQVHRADTVRSRWATPGYFPWHTVSFLPGDMDIATCLLRRRTQRSDDSAAPTQLRADSQRCSHAFPQVAEAEGIEPTRRLAAPHRF